MPIAQSVLIALRVSVMLYGSYGSHLGGVKGTRRCPSMISVEVGMSIKNGRCKHERC